MKYLTALFILLATTCAAQELTADTAAVDVSLWAQIVAVFSEALTQALKAAIVLVVMKAIPLLNAWFKQLMHFRGSDAVADALTEALAEMAQEVQKALADGTISAEEKALLFARAKQIAEAKLRNMSGFYKADLHKWIDEQLNVALSKLLSRTLG